VIEALLCKGASQVPGDLLADMGDRLAPFADAGLATLEGDRLTILSGGLPYARIIAALFDRYRAFAPRRFSSAI